MLLGKSPQAPVMRRTTSMSGGMAVDMPHDDHGGGGGDDDHGDGIKDPHHHAVMPMGHDHGLMVMVPDHQTNNNVFGSKEYEEIHHGEPLLGMVVASPNSHITTNNSNHHSPNQTSNPPTPRVIQIPHFLRTCGLCKCRLAPGRDIYMYRGDTAFCSLECREQRMKEDSRKEKWKMKTSNKESHRASPPAAVAAATAEASTKSEAAACT